MKPALSSYDFLERTDALEQAVRASGFLPPEVTYRQAVVLGAVEKTLAEDDGAPEESADFNDSTPLFPRVILPEEQIPAATLALQPFFDEASLLRFQRTFFVMLKRYKEYMDARKTDLLRTVPFLLEESGAAHNLKFMKKRVCDLVLSQKPEEIRNGWIDLLLFVHGQTSLSLPSKKDILQFFLQEIHQVLGFQRMLNYLLSPSDTSDSSNNICNQIRDEIDCLTKLEASATAP